MPGEYITPRDNRLLELFWKAKGAQQGDMKNQCDMKGYEGFSRVIGVSWGVEGPVDQQSGQRTGQRILEPLVITKKIDHSTPSLTQAMVNNEVIKESEFAYVDVPGHQTQGQKMVRILTIKTENGAISKIEAGTTPEGLLIEKIHLLFNKITWRHEIAKTEATDERVGNTG